MHEKLKSEPVHLQKLYFAESAFIAVIVEFMHFRFVMTGGVQISAATTNATCTKRLEPTSRMHHESET